MSQLQCEVVAVNVNIQSVHATLCQDRVQNPQTAGEWCLRIQVKLWLVIMVLWIPAGRCCNCSICGEKRHIFSIDSQSRVAISCMQPVNYNVFLLYYISYFAKVSVQQPIDFFAFDVTVIVLYRACYLIYRGYNTWLSTCVLDVLR